MVVSNLKKSSGGTTTTTSYYRGFNVTLIRNMVTLWAGAPNLRDGYGVSTKFSLLIGLMAAYQRDF